MTQQSPSRFHSRRCMVVEEAHRREQEPYNAVFADVPQRFPHERPRFFPLRHGKLMALAPTCRRSIRTTSAGPRGVTDNHVRLKRVRRCAKKVLRTQSTIPQFREQPPLAEQRANVGRSDLL